MGWNEKRYAWLQRAIGDILLDGKPVDLGDEKDGARALMAAFLIGAHEANKWNVKDTEMMRLKARERE